MRGKVLYEVYLYVFAHELCSVTLINVHFQDGTRGEFVTIGGGGGIDTI